MSDTIARIEEAVSKGAHAIAETLAPALNFLDIFGSKSHDNAAPAEHKGKVLVVLSSADKITMDNGKQYATGVYLSEVGEPVKALKEAGYDIVFTNPKGQETTIDQASKNKIFFGMSSERSHQMEKFITHLKGWTSPIPLAEVAAGDLKQYDLVFIPGGLPPMVDLWKNESLGKILNYSHANYKNPDVPGNGPLKTPLVAAICHGPVALLSTMKSPETFVNQILHNQPATSTEGFAFAGYKGTVVSDLEDHMFEPGGPANVLGIERLPGRLQFYPQDALLKAGTKLHENYFPGASNVVVDRELITGQNPNAAAELGKKLVEILDHKKR